MTAFLDRDGKSGLFSPINESEVLIASVRQNQVDDSGAPIMQD